MSKRRSSRKAKDRDRMVPEQRDYLHIPKPAKITFAAPRVIRSLEDRREWAPRESYPRGLFRRSTKLEVSQPNINKRKNEVPRKVVFAVPKEVSLCVRRKSRREVLFALRKTGKGSRARIRKRNEYSKMEC